MNDTRQPAADKDKVVAATRELKPLILFDKLDVDEIRAIAALTTTVEHKAGTKIFAQGEAGDCMYVVVSGRVHVEVAKDGKAHQVATLEDGAVLGEVGLVVKDQRSATAVADTDVKLLCLPREKFLAELHKGSLAAYKVGWNIARDLAKKLRAMNKQLGPSGARKPGELAILRTELLKDWTF